VGQTKAPNGTTSRAKSYILSLAKFLVCIHTIHAFALILRH